MKLLESYENIDKNSQNKLKDTLIIYTIIKYLRRLEAYHNLLILKVKVRL